MLSYILYCYILDTQILVKDMISISCCCWSPHSTQTDRHQLYGNPVPPGRHLIATPYQDPRDWVKFGFCLIFLAKRFLVISRVKETGRGERKGPILVGRPRKQERLFLDHSPSSDRRHAKRHLLFTHFVTGARSVWSEEFVFRKMEKGI